MSNPNSNARRLANRQEHTPIDQTKAASKPMRNNDLKRGLASFCKSAS